jgi:hypothetical protein
MKAINEIKRGNQSLLLLRPDCSCLIWPDPDPALYLL